MARTTILTNNFGQGEISESAAGRVDLALFHNSVRTLTNRLPRSIGGLKRRPGTYHAGYAYGTTNKARLAPFRTKYNTYVIELTNTKARFWKTDHTLLGTSTDLTTPWNATENFEFQYANLDNVVYFAHGAFAPRAIAEAVSGTPTISTPTFTGSKTWGSANNYPRIAFVNAGRLGFASPIVEPTLIAQSRAPTSTGYRATDFTAGTYPDDAIIYYACDESGSRLVWALAKRRMAAGSEGTTWVDNGQIATPGTFYLNPGEAINSPTIQACSVGNAIIYVGGPEPSLHMLTYTEEGGGLVDIDLTEFHDHILEAGVVEIFPMLSPERIVWIVRGDGKLASCTLRRAGWGFAVHELPDGGLVQSGCCIRTPTGDEAWLDVKRGSNYCIEWFTIKKDTDQNELHYVDAGIRYSGSPTATITGLAHLNGKEVIGVGDGGALGKKTVSGGSVTFDRAVSIAHVGLPFKSTIRTQRPEIPLNQTWQGKVKKTVDLELRVYRSLGGQIGPDLDNLAPIPDLDLDALGFDTAPVLLSKDFQVDIGRLDEEGSLYIVQEDMWPSTILALMQKIEIEER